VRFIKRKLANLSNQPLLYAFFWVIPRCLNSDAGELPRRKRTIFRTRRKFEIKNNQPLSTRRLYSSIKNILPYTGTGNFKNSDKLQQTHRGQFAIKKIVKEYKARHLNVSKILRNFKILDTKHVFFFSDVS